MARVENDTRSEARLSDERLRELFREMLLIRRFEEKVEERFRAGELPGFLHVAIGQEAIAAGVCAALEPDDVIASTHRAHGHTIAKGTHVNQVMAELYGKKEGCSGGFGGSMHLYDVAKGNLGANAVVGGGLPAIVGAALAFKFKGEQRVGGGVLRRRRHEHGHVPRVAQPRAAVAGAGGLRAREQRLGGVDAGDAAAAAAGRRARQARRGIRHAPRDVDGQDVEAVYAAAADAREHALAKGPVLLHVRTYRLVGHYVGDPQVYRDKDELNESRETQDPLDKLRDRIGLSDEEFEALDQEIEEIVEASVEFAKNGTDPDPEDALKWVYA
jgi:pyruvate dehydrogenase E1 component alpha subunit